MNILNDPQVEFAREWFARMTASWRQVPEFELIPDATFEDGAFAASGSPSHIILQGDAEGLRCGIFSLAEALGIHWFNPADEPILPEEPQKELSGFINRLHRPDFSYRTLHICSMPNHYDRRVCEWMSVNRMNRKQATPAEYDILHEELARFGLKTVYGSHAFYDLVPPEKYFAVHPEYYALIGGKRTVAGGQLCISNPELRKTYLAQVRAGAKLRPGIKFWSLFPNDGRGWCECPACRVLDSEEDRRKGTVNRRYADFVSWICAKAPDIMFRTGSYADFPDFVDELNEIPLNLFVGCTMLYRCLSHPITDPKCPVNPEFADRIRRIVQRGLKVQVGDYYTYRWQSLPAPLWETTALDFRDWHQMGVAGFSCEVSGSESPMWRNYYQVFYLAAQLMWDSSLSANLVLNRLCRASFDSGAEKMYQYYHRMAEGFSDRCFLKKPADFARLFKPELEELVTSGGDANAIVLFRSWLKIAREKTTCTTPREMIAAPYPFTEFKPQKIFLIGWNTLLPSRENPTLAAVYTNREVLAFHLELFEKNMSRLVPGGWCEHDTVEIFLSHGSDSETCYHFLVGCNGELNASECRGRSWNWNWRHHAQAQVQRYSNRWTIDFLIPFADIHCHDSFGFSLVRCRNAGEKFRETTGVPNGGAYFQTEDYIRVCCSPAGIGKERPLTIKV